MRRFILAVLLLVTSVSLPGWAHPATAQEVDRNAPVADTSTRDESGIVGGDEFLTFYESPAFGYVVPWDEDWTAQSSSSGSDGDLLVISREDDTVTFHGYEGHEGDPEACLSESIDQLEGT